MCQRLPGKFHIRPPRGTPRADANDLKTLLGRRKILLYQHPIVQTQKGANFSEEDPPGQRSMVSPENYPRVGPRHGQETTHPIITQDRESAGVPLPHQAQPHLYVHPAVEAPPWVTLKHHSRRGCNKGGIQMPPTRPHLHVRPAHTPTHILLQKTPGGNSSQALPPGQPISSNSSRNHQCSQEK